MAETEKVYTREFYKNELANTEKNFIYQGAMQLASGFLNFDSLQVAATGGGPVALAGRIAALEVAMPWLIKIATDAAYRMGLTSRTLPDASKLDGDTQAKYYTDFDINNMQDAEYVPEVRYYLFYTGGSLPELSGLVSKDFREGKITSITKNGVYFNQILKDNKKHDFSELTNNAYLVLKYKAKLTASSSNPVKIKIAGKEVLQLEGSKYFDEQWHTLVIKLPHDLFSTPISGSIFEMTQNPTAAEKLDIEFAYLTNDVTQIDPGIVEVI